MIDKRTNTGKWLLLLFVCVAITGFAGNTGDSIKTIRLLTVGNSFAENPCTFLEQITNSVPGCTLYLTKANIGGCSLEKHARLMQRFRVDTSCRPYANRTNLFELLQKEKYNYVTIQQASPLSFIVDSLQPYADSLVNCIRQNAPNSEILIQETWAYSPTCPRLASWNISRDSMQRGILKTYTSLIDRYHFRAIPSGNAMYSFYKKYPKVNLWSEKDGFHAGMQGCYLLGCVWFGVLFDISPEKITFVPEGMKPRLAKKMRTVAAREIELMKKNNGVIIY